MTSLQTKKIFIGIFLGALLIAGLFFFVSKEAPEPKTSQEEMSENNRAEETGKEKSEKETTFQWPEDRSLDPEDQKKWDILAEVLESKNDNDPRLDQELRHLSPQMRDKLIKTYDLLPNEERNERGTIAFLIARDLQSVDDAEFLTEVYKEKPCLGLQDCNKEDPSDPHTDGMNQTTLNYPQLAGLYQLERRLAENPDLLKNPEMKKQLSDLIREAKQYPFAAVRKRAEDIQKRYGL